MKKILLFTCMIFIVLTNVRCSINITLRKKAITLRPVDLYVYDAETKEPLKGVMVKVSNAVCYEKIYAFLGIPLDSDFRRTCYPLGIFETNEEGYVHIPEYVYKVKRKRYLCRQSILINIDRINEEDRNRRDAYRIVDFYYNENKHFYRPINKFKAAEIRCRPYQLDEKYTKQLERSKPYVTITFKCYSQPHVSKEYPRDFNCGTEEFKIYLEHFVEP